MSDLEKRKKMLIAEAEVYRQLLKLEVQNLRIYGIKTKRRLTSFSGGNPLLAVGVPMLASLIARKRKARRWGALGFLGWQLYQRFGPAISSRFAAKAPRGRTASQEYVLDRVM